MIHRYTFDINDLESMIVCRNSSGLLHEDDDLPATTTIDRCCGNKVIHENYYKNNLPHRMFGPAVISYDDNGSIIYSKFYVKGLLIGENKEGFWALWEMLTEVERQAPALLKYLAMYS